MAKSRNKNFQAQILFHTKIKTTYQNVVPTTEILELRLKRGTQYPEKVMGQRQK